MADTTEPGLNILDLPQDLLLLISAHLDAHDFLAFCGTCSALHQNSAITLSASYWKNAAQNAFRLRNYPVTASNGHRWMQLYRRMRTQTKVYTWGNNDLGCLGVGMNAMPSGPRSSSVPRQIRQSAGRPRRLVRNTLVDGRVPRSLSWPQETSMGDIGIVADLQCGGWSTVALTTKGELYVVGVIDGSSGWHEYSGPVPKPLTYPPGFVSPGERHDPSTALKSFSAGRAHILGLSDTGRIWSWNNTAQPGLHIKFLTIDLNEGQGNVARAGYTRQVVAGWDRSSAYIVGKGIVVWHPSNTAEMQGQSDQSSVDGMLVLEPWIVPGTSFIQPSGHTHDVTEDSTSKEIGEILTWIVLEAYLLFVTHTGALYGVLMPSTNDDITARAAQPQRLNLNIDLLDPASNNEHVIDIQGAFRNFAVFKRNGTVLVGSQDDVHNVLGAQNTAGHAPPPQAVPRMRKIPALQNSGVMAMAFGDWHSHALHFDGTISSYGKELQGCGSLGLGGRDAVELRGLAQHRPFSDASLPSECITRGRRVCFEREKLEWLDWLVAEGEMSAEASNESERRRQLMRRSEVRAEVSEWCEEKLRRWELDAPTLQENRASGAQAEDDELPAYFALSVAAAGWHSGALVLVNEEKAASTRERYRVRDTDVPEASSTSSIWEKARSFISGFAGAYAGEDPAEWIWEAKGEAFPRLKLKSGEVLPGSAGVIELPDELRDWREVEMVDL